MLGLGLRPQNSGLGLSLAFGGLGHCLEYCGLSLAGYDLALALADALQLQYMNSNSRIYMQERGCLMHFARLANTLLKDEESARDKHVIVCNFAKKFTVFNFFLTHRLRNKPSSIFLLTTPLHLKYAATLPCTFSYVVVLNRCGH